MTPYHLTVPTGRFFARSGRILLPRAVWLDEDGSSQSAAVGATMIPEVPGQEYIPEHEECTTVTTCTPVEDPPGSPDICEDVTTCVIVPEQPAIDPIPGYALLNIVSYSRQFPANATQTESSLAEDLNRAASTHAPLRTEAYGPIPLEPEQDPRLEIASCNLLYNVKTWQIAGHVGSFTFDILVPAGTYAKYEDGTLVDSTAAVLSRTYLSTGARLEFYNEEPVELAASVDIALGREFPDLTGAGSYGEPREVLHQSPSSYVHNPKINIDLRIFTPTALRIASASSGPGRYAGADGYATICGRVLKMTFVGDTEPLTDYSLAITPAAFWESDVWHH